MADPAHPKVGDIISIAQMNSDGRTGVLTKYKVLSVALDGKQMTVAIENVDILKELE